MLNGRAAEQAAIGRLLDAARAGTSGALVLRGEPDIGKTALLDYAAAAAHGFQLVRGTGIESEAELPFAGLHLLLRPALDRAGALPAPQRRAVEGAFGLAPAPPGERAGSITVTLEGTQGGTEVEVVYELTPLSEAGTHHLKQFADGYGDYLQSWEDAIAACLEKRVSS